MALSLTEKHTDTARDEMKPGTQPPNIVLLLLRGLFLAVIIGTADYLLDSQGWIAFGITILLGFLVLAADILIRRKQITTISAVFFGLLVGLLLGTLFSLAIAPVLPPNFRNDVGGEAIKLLITAVCCYVAV